MDKDQSHGKLTKKPSTAKKSREGEKEEKIYREMRKLNLRGQGLRPAKEKKKEENRIVRHIEGRRQGTKCPRRRRRHVPIPKKGGGRRPDTKLKDTKSWGKNKVRGTNSLVEVAF